MTFIHILTLTFISMLAANTLVQWVYKLLARRQRQQESQKS